MPHFDESVLAAAECGLHSFCPMKELPPLPKEASFVSCYGFRKKVVDGELLI